MFSESDARMAPTTTQWRSISIAFSTLVLFSAAAISAVEGVGDERTFHAWAKPPVTLACKKKDRIEHAFFKQDSGYRSSHASGEDARGTRYGLRSGPVGGKGKKYVWRPSKEEDEHEEGNIPPLEKAYMDQNDQVTEEEFHKYMVLTGMRENLPPFQARRSFGDSNVFEKRCRPAAPKLGVAISGGR